MVSHNSIMQWQLYIYTRFNLEDKSPKIISDHTGILSTKDFLSFLDDKSLTYIVTDKIPEMLSTSASNPAIIIITNLIELPTFITSKVSHFRFTHSDVPLNGDISNILKNYSPEINLQLLNYVYATDCHQVITKHNIDSVLTFAKSYDSNKELELLINQLYNLLQSVPQIENVLQLAKVWGRLIYVSVNLKDDRYQNFVERVDNFASSFVLSEGLQEASYASTPKNPKSVDRILPNIKTQAEDKIALICFDCMGYAEWFVLQESLLNIGFSCADTALFTLLPSVTSISRSAIFHGSRNVYNIKSPGRNDEAKSFTEFFTGKEVKYFTDQDTITEDSLLGYNCISILYTFFDDLCHSIQFPPDEKSKSLYFDAVRAYLNKSTVLQTMQTVQNNGFAIYICSDHGSVVAVGNGQKLDKYLIDSFAKRAIIIPVESAALINNTKIKIPFVDDRLIVLPEGRTMFANNNQIGINHGGISLEEMVVPYIRIK